MDGRNTFAVGAGTSRDSRKRRRSRSNGDEDRRHFFTSDYFPSAGRTRDSSSAAEPLSIVGYRCKIARNNDAAVAVEATLQPWRDDARLMLGRYDARHALDAADMASIRAAKAESSADTARRFAAFSAARAVSCADAKTLGGRTLRDDASGSDCDSGSSCSDSVCSGWWDDLAGVSTPHRERKRLRSERYHSLVDDKPPELERRPLSPLSDASSERRGDYAAIPYSYGSPKAMQCTLQRGSEDTADTATRYVPDYPVPAGIELVRHGWQLMCVMRGRLTHGPPQTRTKHEHDFIVATAKRVVESPQLEVLLKVGCAVRRVACKFSTGKPIGRSSSLAAAARTTAGGDGLFFTPTAHCIRSTHSPKYGRCRSRFGVCQGVNGAMVFFAPSAEQGRR